MARTTSTLVRKIADVDPDFAEDDLTECITVANLLTTKVCDVPANNYDADHLEIIERYLAAHFMAIKDLRLSFEQAGSVSARYMYKVELNLALTVYGQQAMILDINGGLAKLNAQANPSGGKTGGKMGMVWLGTADAAVDPISDV